MLLLSSCNLVMVAIKNVPTFFDTPADVKNKIKDPVRTDAKLSALWIGHATVLIQMDDKLIITDPFLTQTAGEFARRVIDPGIDPENIPPCDLVLLSHSHFDHLSLGSLSILDEKSGKKGALVFPNDMENFLPSYDMKSIRLKNDNGYTSKVIGESRVVNGIKITAVYSQHWGGRYGADGYLWGDRAFTGYVLEYKGMTVYFAGDTGYDSLKFRQIGEQFKIDLAFIPIGPCAECNQCGTFNHVFPVDAVMLFDDIGARRMIPIHYGTLHFAQADPMEPLYAFREIVKKHKDPDRFRILNIGEQVVLIKNE
jgi:N-acyl-phosphatidylethanolamine-hydrolysing phospholipase D